MAQAKKALGRSSKKQGRAAAQARTAPKAYPNYIGGEWVASGSGEWFENLNPADTRDCVGRFPLSTAEDIERAVEAARGAAAKWRRLPAPRRAEILFRLGEILIRNKDRFAREMTREMGKVLKETGGDVQEAIDCTYYTAGEGRRLHGFTTPAEMPDKFAMCVRQPVGLCGLITPWNFPMAIPSWKLIPALVCGNTVVIKPAEDTPLSTYNLVSSCAERNAICSLEMGGKNAIIVMDDADIDLAIEGAVWGAFGTSGQRCTASSRIIVHKKVYKKFTQKLA